MSDVSEHSFTRYSIASRKDTREIVHTYTLLNKGPSDAKRTEVKLMWPMLPLRGFNEETPLLYGIDLPSIIRIADSKVDKDQCSVDHAVKLDFIRILKFLCFHNLGYASNFSYRN